MNVKVFYTKDGYSGSSYFTDETIMDYTGGERKYVKPSLEMYEEVGEFEFLPQSNNEIFSKIVTSHNLGRRPELISDRIRSGESNVNHSSFSTGDIIKIEGCYYISNGMTFDLLPLEFSNDD